LKLRSLPYAAYLRTAHWRNLRTQVLAGVHDKCELCGSARATQVHHKTYKRIGRERAEDLMAVCAPCHKAHHGKKLDRKVDRGYIQPKSAKITAPTGVIVVPPRPKRGRRKDLGTAS
jgi:5-methylcytosine-specific restriction endonuclease McrA